MPLIETIEQVRANGVNVAFFNNDSSIADMEAAEERFIVPITGRTLYEAMITDADNISSALKPLIDKARKAIAPLAYWLDLAAIHSTISDRGVGTFISDNMQPAHRWEFEQQKERLHDKGCFALENFLQHLYENAETYEWDQPEDLKLIFLTGTDFKKYYPAIYQPYRVFENLRPLVQMVQDNSIIPLIGEDFLEELRTATEMDDNTAKAILLIKKAVANLTIKQALEMLNVKFSADGFTVALGSKPDAPDPSAQQAPDNHFSVAYRAVMNAGTNYLSQLKTFLDNTASDTVFATYYSSEYYTSPDAAAPDDGNANRTGVFAF